nr:MAG TPA: hypothetical protein [Crassvirales sp.]
MEYKNITFVTGFPIVVNYAELKSIIMHVFFKENNSRITDRIVKKLIEIFENFNISVSVQSSVLEIVTMINYEIFKCGLIIQLDLPENVEININTLEAIQDAIPVIIKLAIDTQKIYERHDAINKDLKVLKSSTSAKKEKCD